MMAFSLTDSKNISLVVSEAVLTLFAVLLIWKKRKTLSSEPASGDKVAKASHLEVLAFALVLILGVSAPALVLTFRQHGEFDAMAIWNTRAKFLYWGEKPLESLSELPGQDYPILLPSLIARGWQYPHHVSTLIPILFELMFTAGIVLIMVSGLQMITSARSALLAAAMLVSTPFFVGHAISQYPDVLISFFVAASVFLFLVCDTGKRGSDWLPFLSGLMLGFAACTKNEGSLYVVAVIAGRALIMIWNRSWRTDAIRIGLLLAGLIPGFLTLFVFKHNIAVSSALAANFNSQTYRTRIFDSVRHQAILIRYWRDLLHFGRWWINPLVLIVLYAVVHIWIRNKTGTGRLWRFPAVFLVLMLVGFYAVYLFSPYDVVWHVDTSFTRLIFQMWPTALILWATLLPVTNSEQRHPL